MHICEGGLMHMNTQTHTCVHTLCLLISIIPNGMLTKRLFLYGYLH